MGLVFEDYPIKGIDVSEFNGVIDWDKVRAKGCNFTAIRIGYGKSTDAKFTNNWQLSRVINRIPYWYMDYYSNHNQYSSVYGMSDRAWGEAQAVYCWNLIKDEAYPFSPVFLDIESGHPSYSPVITTVTNRAQTIARGFLEKMDSLNGKFNGIYCSLGLLSWFGSWFKNRPLWVAWYNEAMYINGVMQNRTVESIDINVKSKGWTGETLMWQYASDGDANDDGFGDGLDFGMDYKYLDLNIWVSTAEKYAEFTGGSVVIPEPPPPPVEGQPLYSIRITVANLNVRSSPYINSTNILRTIGYVTVPIYEEKNGFGRIKFDKQEWVSIHPSYSVKISNPIPLPEGVTEWQVNWFAGLNIRKSPSILSAKIGALRYGSVIKIKDIKNEWGQIYEGFGKGGWVSLKYCKKI